MEQRWFTMGQRRSPHSKGLSRKVAVRDKCVEGEMVQKPILGWESSRAQMRLSL